MSLIGDAWRILHELQIDCPLHANSCVDWLALCSGEEVSLIGDAWRILHELATDPKWQDVEIAYVSRTDEPREPLLGSSCRCFAEGQGGRASCISWRDGGTT